MKTKDTAQDQHQDRGLNLFLTLRFPLLSYGYSCQKLQMTA